MTLWQCILRGHIAYSTRASKVTLDMVKVSSIFLPFMLVLRNTRRAAKWKSEFVLTSSIFKISDGF